MVRNDFVSNSSSASFVVDSEKHGKWFRQLIEIMKKIQEGMVKNYKIDFDGTIIPEDLMITYNYVNSSSSVEEPYTCVCLQKDSISLQSNVISCMLFLNHYHCDHIKHVSCYFHDDCDIGNYAYSIYDKLNATGLEFEWDR